MRDEGVECERNTIEGETMMVVVMVVVVAALVVAVVTGDWLCGYIYG